MVTDAEPSPQGAAATGNRLATAAGFDLGWLALNSPRMPTSSQQESPPRERLDALIVGAGFGGLCTAIQLRRRGIRDFVILEQAPDVGGTWEANTYPGCACDVQSHLYSYSFALNPDWSRVFSPQPEIEAYIRRCAERYDLERHLRLGTRLRQASFDEERDEWSVEAEDGRRWRTRVLVMATGGLSRPSLPAVPGLEEFDGVSFHSARWDPDYDPRGRRVAVVGTGASAIQIVPSIADRVERLYLFQRTPPWILPRFDRRFTRVERWLFRHCRPVMKLYRALLYWRLESRAVVFTLAPALSRLIGLACRWHIRRGISDPDLRAAVTPDYRPGCKRVLLSDDYYTTLERDNVTLVPLGVRAVRPEGLVAEDGSEFAVDTIVFATGFQATHPIPAGQILGRGGVDLVERWRDGAEAYKGMTVSGFPNLFMLGGPNTGLGHNSVVFMIEAQVRYLIGAISAMREARATRVEVRRDVEAAFNARLERRLGRTIWSSGCRSWYLDERGRNVTLWPGFTVEYWWRMRRFDGAAYRLSSSPGPAATAATARAA
jgi:cation diffusion facilitator CzcD-associated flavoprotein CzcO